MPIKRYDEFPVIVTPPESIIPYVYNYKGVFLAGSIEMGKATNWQAEFIEKLSGFHCIIYNPRRTDWDSSWEQKIDNAKFREQVEWELSTMELCSVIAMNFVADTQSPITLLELGLHARTNPKKLLVHCPEGYWRKGNVDIVCRRYGVQMCVSLDDLILETTSKLTKLSLNMGDD